MEDFQGMKNKLGLPYSYDVKHGVRVIIIHNNLYLELLIVHGFIVESLQWK